LTAGSDGEAAWWCGASPRRQVVELTTAGATVLVDSDYVVKLRLQRRWTQ